MKKILLFSLTLCLLGFSNVCFSEELKSEEQTSSFETKIQKSAEENQIEVFIKKVIDAQNAHSISSLKKYYVEEFMNADGFNRKQLFELMEKTYSNFPDIKAVVVVEKMIVSENYAMAYLKQTVNANTRATSKITGDKGVYEANLNTVWYLKKINKDWKIYSEDVTYETSRLAYGKAKDIKAKINAPQMVLANVDYCAGVNIDIPSNFSAIASVNNTQIVQGFDLTGENFRQVNPDKATLERILKANDNNNNEAVVISVGLTEATQDTFKKPKIDISGLLMLMQRVDVVPKNDNIAVQKDKNGASK